MNGLLKDEITRTLYPLQRDFLLSLSKMSREEIAGLCKEFRSEDFFSETSRWKKLIESYADAVLTAINPIMNQMNDDSEHYQLLPPVMRDFLESDPRHMFLLSSYMMSSIDANRTLTEIESFLHEQVCPHCISTNEKCPLRTLIGNRDNGKKFL